MAERKPSDRLAILAYHSIDETGSVVSVSPRRFADHMNAIAEADFRAVTLADAEEHRASSGKWPDRAVVITFDDAFSNVHELALPVLQEHGFTATVFVINDYIDSANEWERSPPGLGRQTTMNEAQLAALATEGWEIGAHTKTHPDLRELSDAQLEEQIVGSRTDLEQRLGRSVESFAYPYGMFDQRAERIAADHYRAACTTRLQRAGSDTRSRLPRIDTYYVRDQAMMRRLLLGQLDGYLTIRRWARAIRPTKRREPISD